MSRVGNRGKCPKVQAHSKHRRCIEEESAVPLKIEPSKGTNFVEVLVPYSLCVGPIESKAA